MKFLNFKDTKPYAWKMGRIHPIFFFIKHKLSIRNKVTGALMRKFHLLSIMDNWLVGFNKIKEMDEKFSDFSKIYNKLLSRPSP